MPKRHNDTSSTNYISSLIKTGKLDRYKVPFGQHAAGWLHSHCRAFSIKLAQLETLAWDDQIENQAIDSPVYICGLARSGTTVLLEHLYATGYFATHRYKDYPFIDTPILWNKWQKLFPSPKKQEQERAHFDKIMITPDSPEAFEEMIWMAFFPNGHNSAFSQILDESFEHKSFEKYYKTHIKKILWLRQGSRYLAKGNYNFTRIGYLHKLYPDARFIIPIREPSAHIFSLIKQHHLFCEIEKRDKRALKYMEWSGHYEFGQNRTPINTGDIHRIEQIKKAWACSNNGGDEITGWALYWDMLHQWLYNTLENNKELRDCVKLVSYEELCQKPEEILAGIFKHCGTQIDEKKCRDLSSKIKEPGYYKRSYSDEEIKTISEITESTYQKLISQI